MSLVKKLISSSEITKKIYIFFLITSLMPEVLKAYYKIFQIIKIVQYHISRKTLFNVLTLPYLFITSLKKNTSTNKKNIYITNLKRIIIFDLPKFINCAHIFYSSIHKSNTKQAQNVFKKAAIRLKLNLKFSQNCLKY